MGPYYGHIGWRAEKDDFIWESHPFKKNHSAEYLKLRLVSPLIRFFPAPILGFLPEKHETVGINAHIEVRHKHIVHPAKPLVPEESVWHPNLRKNFKFFRMLDPHGTHNCNCNWTRFKLLAVIFHDGQSYTLSSNNFDWKSEYWIYADNVLLLM